MVKFIKERNRWEATVYVGGRRIRTYHGTKKEAADFKREAKRDATFKKFGMSGIKRPYPLAAAFASFLETNSAQKTERSKDADERLFNITRHYLETCRNIKHVGDVRLEDLELLAIWLEKEQSFGGQIKEPWSASTIWNKSLVLKKFFRKMLHTDRISKNPAEFWKVPRGTTERRRAMSKEEYLAIFDLAPAWFRPILAFMRLTGARGASVASLTWSDIDFEGQQLRLRSRKGGLKREKTIELPIYPALNDLLSWVQNSGTLSRGNDPVFMGPKGFPVTAQEISTAGHTLIRKSGIDGVVLYGLRHAIAVEMTAAGINLEIVRQTMGHSTIRETAHYASGISKNVVSDALKQIRGRVENGTPLTSATEDEPPDLGEN